MPRGKRRRWRRFVKRVNAVDERELGSQTVVFNNSISVETTNPDNQLLENVALYPQTSTNAWLNDLNNISGYFNAGPAVTAGSDDYVNATTKVMFHSGVLDVTVRNTSKDNTGAPLDIPLEVDVYEISVRHGEDDSVLTSATELKDYFDQGAADTLDIGGTVAAIPMEIIKRGVTPWDLPAALSSYKIKIWKKTKYFIGLGQTFTYQMRDPKRHVTTIGKMARGTTCNHKGLTKWIFFIGKAVPGIGVGSNVIPRLNFGVTRKYLMKVEGMRTARDYYLKV